MEKMRNLSMMLLVSMMLLTGLSRAEHEMPMMQADDLALHMDADADDAEGATRGSIKKFSTLIACNLQANNASINNARVDNLVVVNNEQIGGNLLVEGNLTVLGDYVPLTINLTPGTDKISTALAALSDDNANFGSVLINLAPGAYIETAPFDYTTQVQALTIIGDTNPLAGVGYMQGGLYGGPAYNIQRQLNAEIGLGCNFDISFDATGAIMTVAATDAACLGSFALVQPDFSGVSAGTLVGFIGTDGVISTYAVAARTIGLADNQIIFTSAVAPTVIGTNIAGTPSDSGVAFAFYPNVTIQGPAGNSSFTGPKNLKFQGIFFNWSTNSGILYLGGVNTKMELSNSILFPGTTGVAVISAEQSYNRQPNTFIGSTLLSNTVSDFIYNSVWQVGLQVTGVKGTFSYGQFAQAALRADAGARFNAQYTRLFLNDLTDTGVTVDNVSGMALNNSIIGHALVGVSVTNGSSADLEGATIFNGPTITVGTTGLVVANSSTITNGSVALDIFGFDLAINLNLTAAAIITGIGTTVDAPVNNFAIIIDNNVYGNSTTLLNLAPTPAYQSGVLGTKGSYYIS